MRTGATIIVSSTNSIFFPPVATIDLECTFAGLCHCRRPPDVDRSVRPSPRREVQVLQGRGVPTAARVPSPHQRGCGGGPSTQAAGHSPKTRAEEAIHLRVHGRWQNRRLTNYWPMRDREEIIHESAFRKRKEINLNSPSGFLCRVPAWLCL